MAPSEWLTYPKKRRPKVYVFLHPARQALALRISSDHQSNSLLLRTELEFVDSEDVLILCFQLQLNRASHGFT